MGIVRHTLRESDLKPLTEEDLAMYEKMNNTPIDYSDDPKRTPEELRQMRRWAEERRRKKVRKLYSFKLETSTIKWWRSLGKEYTNIMAKFLDSAKNHPEWVKECIDNAT